MSPDPNVALVGLQAPPTWLPAWLEGAWGALAVHPLLLAGAIFALGLLAAVLVRSVLLAWGLRLAQRIPTDLDDELIRLGAGVVPSLLVFLSLIAAVHTLPLAPLVTTITTRVLASVLIFQMIRTAFRVGYLGVRFLGTMRERYHLVEERTIPLFDLMATVIIVGLGMYGLLVVWRIDPTAWVASAGLIGIAVGFAAKDSLANLFAGLSIIADAPYKVGDFVVLDSGERGEVTKVGIRSTRMVTLDDVEVVIPNTLMANQKIVNESGGRWIKSRIKLRVGVAYGSDVDRVIALLDAVPRRHAIVADDPAPRVRMVGFAESRVEFDLQCWVNHPSERGAVMHELFVDIYKSLAEAGIEIPLPQRELRVRRPSAEARSERNGKGTAREEERGSLPSSV